MSKYTIFIPRCQGWSLVWTVQAISLLGSSLAGFALVWWLTSTTGSAFSLAPAARRIVEKKLS